MVTLSFLNAVDITTIVFIVLLVLLIVALLVVPLFTNKKRARETEQLHSSLKPGDLIKTVGGVIGTIKEIRQVSPVDKEMVIETGEEGNKTTMTFDLMALYQVMSRANTIVAPEEEHANEAPETKSDESAPVAAADDRVADEKEQVADATPEQKTEEPAAETTAEASEAPEAEKQDAAPAGKKPIKRKK